MAEENMSERVFREQQELGSYGSIGVWGNLGITLDYRLKDIMWPEVLDTFIDPEQALGNFTRKKYDVILIECGSNLPIIISEEYPPHELEIDEYEGKFYQNPTKLALHLIRETRSDESVNKDTPIIAVSWTPFPFLDPEISIKPYRQLKGNSPDVLYGLTMKAGATAHIAMGVQPPKGGMGAIISQLELYIRDLSK